jgi:membrane protein implicated in regulation of membrane protease activity
MALELLAPGVFLFWLGLAALLVGLLSFAIIRPGRRRS